MHPPCSGFEPVDRRPGSRPESGPLYISGSGRLVQPLLVRAHGQFPMRPAPRAGPASMRLATDVGSAMRGKDPRDRHDRDHRSAHRRR